MTLSNIFNMKNRIRDSQNSKRSERTPHSTYFAKGETEAQLNYVIHFNLHSELEAASKPDARLHPGSQVLVLPIYTDLCLLGASG